MKKILVFMLLLVLSSVSLARKTGSPEGMIGNYGGTQASTAPSQNIKAELDAILTLAGKSMTNAGTGNIYYVDSGVTSAGDGSSWTNALATLDAAINKCTANNGDVIYVATGHAETFAAANGFNADIAGITIIGIGNGALAPTFTYSTTDSTANCGAASIVIYNLRFLAGVSEVVTAITVAAAADDCAVINCLFPEPATSTYEFDKGIVLASGADRFTLKNCTSYRCDSTGATSFIEAVAGVVNGLTIKGNTIIGEYSQAPIYSDQINLETQIEDNFVYNMTTGQYAIEFSAAATGFCARNIMYTDTIATTLDPGSMACFENYGINTVDLSAILIPSLPAIGTVTAGSADDILKKLYYGTDGTGAYPATVANDSALAMIMCKGATATTNTYSNTTDSLEAIADHVQGLLTTSGGTGNYPTGIADETILAYIMGKGGTASASTFVNTTDSLEAIRDNIDTLNAADQVDLDAILADTAAMQPVTEMCISKTISTIANGANNLFAVTGGPIKITEIVAYVTTTTIGSEGCLIGYNIDPTTPGTDTAFGTDGTALEINADAVGTLYTWDGVLAADLVEVTNGVAVAMGTDVSYGLIVPIGMIELTATVGAPPITGEITVYMRYIPLSPASVVTAQ